MGRMRAGRFREGEHVLRAFGHEVEAEASGEAALEHLRRRGFDVLFSDVSLPGISGVELARRAVAELPALQVIFALLVGTFVSIFPAALMMGILPLISSL